MQSINVNVKRRGPLTPWELPSLLTPLHSRRQRTSKKKKERPHYPAVLAFVYRNRFAVASQIQRRFPDVLRSDRTARRHLEELQGLGYLAVAPGRGVGPLFPKVYYVTGRGVRRLRKVLASRGKEWQESRVDRRGRDANEGYASDHLIHELLITEFLLALWQTVEQRPDLKLSTVQRRSLVKHKAFKVTVAGKQTRLVPDAMFVFHQQDRGTCCCLVEIDNGTMNRKQIQRKYQRYERWTQSAVGRQYLIDLYRRHGVKEPRPTFRLLIVARSRTGQDDANRVAELLAAARFPFRNYIWLTSVMVLASHQHDDCPLEKKLWIKGSNQESSSCAETWQTQIDRGARHSLFTSIASANPS